MDKKYNQLFTLITQVVSDIAEQVMTAHKGDEDPTQYNAATTMYTDYLALNKKLKEIQPLTKPDYARLLIGSVMVITQLESRIKNDEAALTEYKEDLLPKLGEINEADTEEEAIKLAEELFSISDN